MILFFPQLVSRSVGVAVLSPDDCCRWPVPIAFPFLMLAVLGCRGGVPAGGFAVPAAPVFCSHRSDVVPRSTACVY